MFSFINLWGKISLHGNSDHNYGFMFTTFVVKTPQTKWHLPQTKSSNISLWHMVRRSLHAQCSLKSGEDLGKSGEIWWLNCLHWASGMLSSAAAVRGPQPSAPCWMRWWEGASGPLCSYIWLVNRYFASYRPFSMHSNNLLILTHSLICPIFMECLLYAIHCVQWWDY